MSLDTPDEDAVPLRLDRAPEAERAFHHPGPGSAALLTLAAIFASGFVAVLLISGLGEGAALAALAVGKVVAFTLFGTLASFRVPGPHDLRMGLRGFSTHMLGPMLLLLPVVFLLSEVDNYVLALLPVPPEVLEKLAEAEAIPTTVWTWLQLFIVTVCLLPVVDEWFFRGVVQQGVVAHSGHLRGVLMTAVLFAPSHMNAALPATGPLLSALFTSLTLGVLLGLVRIGAGSVLAAMAFHAAFNAIGLAGTAGEESMPIEGFNVRDSYTSWWILVPSLASVVMGMRLLWPEVKARATIVPLPRDAAGPLGPMQL